MGGEKQKMKQTTQRLVISADGSKDGIKNARFVYH